MKLIALLLCMLLAVLLIGCAGVSQSQSKSPSRPQIQNLQGTVTKVGGSIIDPQAQRCGQTPTYVLHVQTDQGEFVFEVIDRYGDSPKTVPGLASVIHVGSKVGFVVRYDQADSAVEFTHERIGRLTPHNLILLDRNANGG